MLSLAVLASGSSGNCTLVRLDGDGSGRRRYLLIDAGLSPRATAGRLDPLGVTLDDVDDILLTHLDHDHLAAGWAKAVQRHDIAVHVHRRHVRRATDRVPVPRLHSFEDEPDLGHDVHVRGHVFAHDQLGSVGYRIEHAGRTLGFATDLGRVPDSLIDHFTGVDALAIESNYDPNLQRESERPAFLKRRIMGGMGHLSNQQALDAIRAIDRRSDLGLVVLLHLSRDCNDPALVKRLFARRAPHLADRLTITDQHEPTPLLDVGGSLPHAQLALFA